MLTCQVRQGMVYVKDSDVAKPECLVQLCAIHGPCDAGIFESGLKKKAAQPASKLCCRRFCTRFYLLSDPRSHFIVSTYAETCRPSPVRRDADPVHGLNRSGKIIRGMNGPLD